MSAIINIFCFVFAFLVIWKFVRHWLGIKRYGVIIMMIGLNFSFIYLCAKYFGVGFVLLPSKTVLFDPNTAMAMSVAMVKTTLFSKPTLGMPGQWNWKPRQALPFSRDFHIHTHKLHSTQSFGRSITTLTKPKELTSHRWQRLTARHCSTWERRMNLLQPLR